jgi:hypothetical protein
LTLSSIPAFEVIVQICFQVRHCHFSKVTVSEFCLKLFSQNKFNSFTLFSF